MKTVFNKTDILLPHFASDDKRWGAWSVIACDQHTSEPDFWAETYRTVGDDPSTLGLILPEAYLGTEREASKKGEIKEYPAKLDGILKKYDDALIYVERTLESGMIRRGIVGAIDLDAYDYEAGTSPDVRPTEGTVKERIPPRVAVRRDSVYEASHVMLFTEGYGLFDMLTSCKDSLPVLYDFDLMQGGGHITGRLVMGDALKRAEELISEYEEERRREGKMIYGVGDGNHSLASAKAYLEGLRASGQSIGGAESALVELVPITERAIVFEPIYKTVSGVDTDRFISYIKDAVSKGGTVKEVEVLSGDICERFSVSVGDGEIVCGVIQAAIDTYISKYGGVCDYIHGKENTRALAKDGTVGFIFDGIEKEELFPYVGKYGVLPRKAFSMGEASEKRYYTELRKLK